MIYRVFALTNKVEAKLAKWNWTYQVHALREIAAVLVPLFSFCMELVVATRVMLEIPVYTLPDSLAFTHRVRSLTVLAKGIPRLVTF